MALTVPSVDDLVAHARSGPLNDVWAEDDLQAATDLMQLATGLDTDPTDAFALRVMTRGILAMAHALYVRSVEKAAIYSLLSSERLGSYSYTKDSSKDAPQLTTGVDLFDLAVRYLLGLDDETPTIWAESDEVFEVRDPGSFNDDSTWHSLYDAALGQDP